LIGGRGFQGRETGCTDAAAGVGAPPSPGTGPKPDPEPTQPSPPLNPPNPPPPQKANGAAKNAAAPAFIRGKRGAALAPGAFPSRGYALADADLRVAAASRLVDIDDAGEEAELVDYWTNDGLRRPSKARLSKLGAKIEADAEGGLAVVAREGADGGAAAGEAALELLAGITDADLDSIVADLLAEVGAFEGFFCLVVSACGVFDWR
jgi:hypothetical protein